MMATEVETAPAGAWGANLRGFSGRPRGNPQMDVLGRPIRRCSVAHAVRATRAIDVNQSFMEAPATGESGQKQGCSTGARTWD